MVMRWPTGVLRAVELGGHFEADHRHPLAGAKVVVGEEGAEFGIAVADPGVVGPGADHGGVHVDVADLELGVGLQARGHPGDAGVAERRRWSRRRRG